MLSIGSREGRQTPTDGAARAYLNRTGLNGGRYRTRTYDLVRAKAMHEVAPCLTSFAEGFKQPVAVRIGSRWSSLGRRVSLCALAPPAAPTTVAEAARTVRTCPPGHEKPHGRTPAADRRRVVGRRTIA